MKMESKIDQNDDYFFRNLEIQFQNQNLKLALLFFENFTVDFQISYFREKKLSGQIVACFPVKSQYFKEFYDFILGHGLDSPRLNRMALKKDMKNDNTVQIKKKIKNKNCVALDICGFL